MVTTVYTSAGEGHGAGYYTGTTTSTAFWIGWGTGGSSTAGGNSATKSDTALHQEGTDVRATTAVTLPSADTTQFVGTLTVETVAKTIEEAGLFTTATGGIMPIRGNHGGVALATDDSIQYTITLEQT